MSVSRQLKARAAGDDERCILEHCLRFVQQVAHLAARSVPARCRLVVTSICLLALLGCDPIPKREVPPPGGYRARPSDTGRAAIRAVLFTPSHGSFRTVREAVKTYLGRATDAVQVRGWSAAGVTSPTRRYYDVDFAWYDGREPRQAHWELDGQGVWPANNEARILTVFPPGADQ